MNEEVLCTPGDPVPTKLEETLNKNIDYIGYIYFVL
jgi:hypothetical protein